MNKSDEMRKYVFSIVVFALLCLLLLAGCSSVKNSGNAADNGAKDDSLKVVNERGRLIIGTEANYPPLEFSDSLGEFVGFEVDIAKEIAAQLGVEADFSIMPWDNLFDAVKLGSVDISIASTTITSERSINMLFSVPYFDAGQVILVKSSSTETISGVSDLKDKNVVAEKGTTGEEAIKKYSGFVISYENTPENPFVSRIQAELIEGKIDAVVMDYIGAVNLAKENLGLKIVGEPFSQEYYGIATKLGNVALMDEVNLILRDMKRSGKLDDIKNKWLK